MTGCAERPFKTAVVPAAGMGTRFLPATKTVPKELLPVVDTPGIELVASEAAQAGAERLVIVTAPGKASVVGHFVEDLVLEGKLAASGKHHLLERVRRAPGLISVEPVVQESPLGLGHAVGLVESVLDADEDSFAVLASRRSGPPLRHSRRDGEGTCRAWWFCAVRVRRRARSCWGLRSIRRPNTCGGQRSRCACRHRHG